MTNKFHAAVNYVADNAILCRIKELGNESPTLKLDKSAFGDIPATKGESFVVELSDLLKDGNYLIAGNAKIITRERQDAVPFDVDSYMAGLIATEEEESNIDPIF